MSAIDCHDHSYLGEIAGIPLYLLNEDTEDEEFAYAKKGQILLGGGSGECASLLLKDNLYALLAFMTYGQSLEDTNIFSDEDCKSIPKIKFRAFEENMWNAFTFCKNWTWNAKLEFILDMKNNLNDPHVIEEKDKEYSHPELVLLASIGELIYFSFPEWYPELIAEYKEWHLANHKDSFLRHIFCNIAPSQQGFIDTLNIIEMQNKTDQEDQTGNQK